MGTSFVVKLHLLSHFDLSGNIVSQSSVVIQSVFTGFT